MYIYLQGYISAHFGGVGEGGGCMSHTNNGYNHKLYIICSKHVFRGTQIKVTHDNCKFRILWSILMTAVRVYP